MKFALATAIQFSRCNKIHNLVPRAYWRFDMKEGAFLPIRKPRNPGNVAKYKQIDLTHVDGFAE